MGAWRTQWQDWWRFLLISDAAHLVLPYHRKLDEAKEIARGDAKIGTTLKGIGPAYSDKANRTGVRVAQSLDDEAFAEAVRRISGARGLDVIFDSLGGEYYARGRKLLRAGGRIVCYGAASSSSEKQNVFKMLKLALGFGRRAGAEVERDHEGQRGARHR